MKIIKDKEDQIIELLTELRDIGNKNSDISEKNIEKNKQLYAEYLEKHNQRTKMFLIIAAIFLILFLILSTVLFK